VTVVFRIVYTVSYKSISNNIELDSHVLPMPLGTVKGLLY